MNTAHNIKTLLVDDEPGAIEVLQSLLKLHPDIEVVGHAADAYTGLELIKTLQPDLVFLDVRMPRKSGFDLVKDLHNHQLDPFTIFVTAYDEYAIRAFKVSAFDYLLKPVDPDALSDTLRRFRVRRSEREFGSKFDHLLKHLHHEDRIRLNTRSGFLLIDPDEIMYALAEGNYTTLYFTPSRSELVTMNIGKLMEMLPEGHFVRISRSALINRATIYRVERKKRICELRSEGEHVILEISGDHLRDLA